MPSHCGHCLGWFECAWLRGWCGDDDGVVVVVAVDAVVVVAVAVAVDADADADADVDVDVDVDVDESSWSEPYVTSNAQETSASTPNYFRNCTRKTVKQHGANTESQLI